MDGVQSATVADTHRVTRPSERWPNTDWPAGRIAANTDTRRPQIGRTQLPRRLDSAAGRETAAATVTCARKLAAARRTVFRLLSPHYYYSLLLERVLLLLLLFEWRRPSILVVTWQSTSFAAILYWCTVSDFLLQFSRLSLITRVCSKFSSTIPWFIVDNRLHDHHINYPNNIILWY